MEIYSRKNIRLKRKKKYFQGLFAKRLNNLQGLKEFDHHFSK